MPVRNSRSAASLSCALTIGGILVYVAIDVVLIFLRPHFSVLHSAESDYGSKGRYAWLMDLNFLLRAALSLAAIRALTVAGGTARGMRMRVGLSLLGIWAVCSGALAFFADNPVGTPLHGSGRVHLALAFVAFFAVLLGTLTVTIALRPLPRWASARRVLVVLGAIAIVPLLLLGHAHLRPDSLGGLYEKLFLALELAWLGVAAWFAARIGPPPEQAAA
jgi:hypothetical membrane protein